jgi:hypothetical protein
MKRCDVESSANPAAAHSSAATVPFGMLGVVDLLLSSRSLLASLSFLMVLSDSKILIERHKDDEKRASRGVLENRSSKL